VYVPLRDFSSLSVNVQVEQPYKSTDSTVALNSLNLRVLEILLFQTFSSSRRALQARAFLVKMSALNSLNLRVLEILLFQTFSSSRRALQARAFLVKMSRCCSTQLLQYLKSCFPFSSRACAMFLPSSVFMSLTAVLWTSFS